jgi:hypothetical protein
VYTVSTKSDIGVPASVLENPRFVDWRPDANVCCGLFVDNTSTKYLSLDSGDLHAAQDLAA